MNRYGGCKKAAYPAHETRSSFRLHPAMRAVTTPQAVNLRTMGLTPPVKDQGPSASCNGHRCSSAVQTRCAAIGTPLPWTPSETDIYRAAREIERARLTPTGEPLPALTDIGSYTEDCVAAMRNFGIRPRSILRTRDGRDSDAEPFSINDDQKLGELEASAMTLLTGEHAIDPQAPDTVLQIRAALAALVPVGIDFFVDEAFEAWGEAWTQNSQPCGPPDMRDPNGGGHAILCTGYRTEPNGATSFMLLNSWGKDVADAGAWWCNEAWLRKAWEISVWDVRLISNLVTGAPS